MTTTRCPTFTTTVRVINRVHNAHHAPTGARLHVRIRPALPKFWLLLSGFDTAPTVASIPDGPYASSPETGGSEHSHHRDQQTERTCRQRGNLTALAWLHLDVVNDRTDWHARKWHRITGLDIAFAEAITCRHTQALRRQNIRLFAVFISYQRDKRRPVGIIFNPLNRCRHVQFVAFEINNTVQPFRPATAAAGCNTSGVVAAARFCQTLE